MYHFANHQIYQQTAYPPQQCSLYIDSNTKHSTAPPDTQTPFENIQNNIFHIQPEVIDAPRPERQPRSKKKKVVNGTKVDTSSYSIEERLVAAVWVHERKNTKMSMSQIKQDFRQRFAREPPTKNTLLVWERKLFSTGSVHDAPRAGRPINRSSRTAEVAASVRSAPGLSLRARARALRLPRTTLRTILRTDLRHHTGTAPTTDGNHETRINVRRRKKLETEAAGGATSGQIVRTSSS